MNKFLSLLIGLIGVIWGGQTAQAAPRTQTQVSHPTTTQGVNQSLTQTAVTHPVSTVVVDRPTTTTVVPKLQTTTVVEHPTTSVAVSHPQTDAPATASSEKAGFGSSSSSSHKGAAAASKDAKPSMMSTYTPPKATDFQAAKTGGGEEGLGKLNQAEKDAAAQAFVPPKAEEVSLENVLKSDKNTVNIKKKVEKKAQQ